MGDRVRDQLRPYKDSMQADKPTTRHFNVNFWSYYFQDTSPSIHDQAMCMNRNAAQFLISKEAPGGDSGSSGKVDKGQWGNYWGVQFMDYPFMENIDYIIK